MQLTQAVGAPPSLCFPQVPAIPILETLDKLLKIPATQASSWNQLDQNLLGWDPGISIS